jgi:hypothetical protein
VRASGPLSREQAVVAFEMERTEKTRRFADADRDLFAPEQEEPVGKRALRDPNFGVEA